MTTRKCIVQYGFEPTEFIGVEMIDDLCSVNPAAISVICTLDDWAWDIFGAWDVTRVWVGSREVIRIADTLEVPLAIAITACVTNRNVRNIDQDIGNILPRGRLQDVDLEYIMSWLEDQE